MNLASFSESFSIAVAALRAAKARAALTVLGVAIGVTAVMAMSALVQGINQGVAEAFNQLGQETFFVMRHFQAGVNVNDGSTQPWMHRPNLEISDVEAIRRLESIGMVGYRSDAFASASARGEKIAGLPVLGMSENWGEVDGGEIIEGRNFTEADDRSSAPVVVINQAVSKQLFPTGIAVGKEVRVGNARLRVIGLYREPPNAFQKLAADNPVAVVPYRTLLKNFDTWPDAFSILLKPKKGLKQDEVMDSVIALMRQRHSLRPGDPNDFDVVPQAKMLESFQAFTSTFFLIMIAMASIGLTVGGVGVIGIMMIAVTERTKEIGVRKALGARRSEILVQFLVEAVLVTLVGAIIGMLAGWGIARLVAALTPIPAAVPLWAVVTALCAAVVTGIGFGLYPAARASKLDPVTALRYE